MKSDEFLMASLALNSEKERIPVLLTSSASNKASHSPRSMDFDNFMCPMNASRLILLSLLASIFLNNIIKIIFQEYTQKSQTYIECHEGIYKLVRGSHLYPVPEFLTRKLSISIYVESIKETFPVSFGFFSCVEQGSKEHFFILEFYFWIQYC